MKNIKYIIITILLFIVPLVVKAEVSGVLSCNKTSIKKGDTFICDVLVTGEDVETINANITYSKSHLNLTKIEGTNSWTSNSSSKISLSHSSTTLNGTKVATIYFNVLAASSHASETITASGDFTAAFNYTILSSNNKIKSIYGTCGDIQCLNYVSPSNNLEKTLKKSAVKFTVSLEDSSAKLKTGYGSRTVDLDYGENIIKFIVVAESGEENTYTLKITRPDSRNSNNNLSSLSVEGASLKPKFNASTLNYEVTVKETLGKAVINAKLENSKASFIDKLGPRTVKLKEGKNEFAISVKAENGEIKTYKITINRGTESSSNAYLKSLAVEGVNLNFRKEQLEYNIKVLANVDTLKITATPESGTATVKIDGNNIESGKTNVVTITVTSENGEQKVYKINAVKLDQGQVLSSNTKLKSIEITGYKIDFNSDVYDYNLKIKNTSRLYITAKPEDNTSVVKVSGNTNLKNGSVVKITVIGEDTSESIYTITIEKDSSKLFLVLAIGLTVILAIGILCRKIYEKTKNKKSYEEDLTLDREENDRVIIK